MRQRFSPAAKKFQLTFTVARRAKKFAAPKKIFSAAYAFPIF
jgi:hypothetical protein